MEWVKHELYYKVYVQYEHRKIHFETYGFKVIFSKVAF
mgnify:CR=1 FL=1